MSHIKVNTAISLWSLLLFLSVLFKHIKKLDFRISVYGSYIITTRAIFESSFLQCYRETAHLAVGYSIVNRIYKLLLCILFW